jgi:chromosome segregation ATPase
MSGTAVISEREKLRQRIQEIRDEIAKIPADLEELRQARDRALDSGDRTAAKRAMQRMAELEQENGLAEEEVARLEKRWPEIERAEAKDQIPVLEKQLETARRQQEKRSRVAVEKYLAVLDELHQTRLLEKEVERLEQRRLELYDVAYGAARVPQRIEIDRFPAQPIWESANRLHEILFADPETGALR